jgi:hypothetical protein
MTKLCHDHFDYLSLYTTDDFFRALRFFLGCGVFGGRYMTDCQDEFPKDWFTNAKIDPNGPDKNLNFFKVNASQPLKVWIKKGWIRPQDQSFFRLVQIEDMNNYPASCRLP